MSGKPVSNATLFGHPAGLFVLFLTEMWERFSYYGMRALLVFYMTKHLMMAQQDASRLYGLYCGLVYFTPFLGGLLADRVLGRKRCVVLGGLLMTVGHFLMAFESLFYPALAFLILGNGAFKPNISAQVGGLYADGDPRRDRAFSVFYVGINLGAFFSPIVCGALGELWGWHYGFGAAGVGMLAGLGVYLFGQRFLPAETRPKPFRDETPAEAGADKNRALGIVAVCLAVVLFWAVYEQMGNTLALFVDEDTDRNILGWEMPATWFQALNPFLIFALTPLITSLWARQAKRGSEPSSLGKMGLGLCFTGAGFVLMMYPASLYAVDGTPVSMLWLVFFTVCITLGELYLSPIGLSLITKLAPAGMISMFMGVWFMAQFLGNLAAGYLGGYWETLSRPVFFGMLAGVAFVAALLIAAMLRPLNRVLADKRD